MRGFVINSAGECVAYTPPGGHIYEWPPVLWDRTIHTTDSGNDPVNNPKHYTGHPSGVECIQITEHMGFNLGNVVKYVWRADLKGNALEDLRKARFYLDREIAKREDAGKDYDEH